MHKYSKLLLVLGLAGVLSIALLAGSALAQGTTPNPQSYGTGCDGMDAGMMQSGMMGHGVMHGAGYGMMGTGVMRGVGHSMMGTGMMRGLSQATHHSGMMGGAWSAETAITGTVPFDCPMAEDSDAASALPTSLEQARVNAEKYLTDHVPGASLAENQQVSCGHYTFDVLKDDKPAGRLSVNGYTGQVWHQAE